MPFCRFKAFLKNVRLGCRHFLCTVDMRSWKINGTPLGKQIYWRLVCGRKKNTRTCWLSNTVVPVHSWTSWKSMENTSNALVYWRHGCIAICLDSKQQSRRWQSNLSSEECNHINGPHRSCGETSSSTATIYTRWKQWAEIGDWGKNTKWGHRCISFSCCHQYFQRHHGVRIHCVQWWA